MALITRKPQLHSCTQMSATLVRKSVTKPEMLTYGYTHLRHEVHDMTIEQDHFSIDDELATWVEDESSIHIKAVSKEGDPVELDFDEAEELAHRLLKWVEKYR